MLRSTRAPSYAEVMAPIIAAIRAELAERRWSVAELHRRMGHPFCTGSAEGLRRGLRNGTISPCELGAVSEVFGDDWALAVADDVCGRTNDRSARAAVDALGTRQQS